MLISNDGIGVEGSILVDPTIGSGRPNRPGRGGCGAIGSEQTARLLQALIGKGSDQEQGGETIAAPGIVDLEYAGIPIASDPGGADSSRGMPLPQALRGTMEALFGEDFRDVRIHFFLPGSGIACGIRAIACGSDIFFEPGQFDPESPAGRWLMAHELAHVVQQRQGRVASPFDSGLTLVDDAALEAEADLWGSLAVVEFVPRRRPAPGRRFAAEAEHPRRRAGVVQCSSFDDSRKALEAFFKLKFQTEASLGLRLDDMARKESESRKAFLLRAAETKKQNTISSIDAVLERQGIKKPRGRQPRGRKAQGPGKYATKRAELLASAGATYTAEKTTAEQEASTLLQNRRAELAAYADRLKAQIGSENALWLIQQPESDQVVLLEVADLMSKIMSGLKELTKKLPARRIATNVLKASASLRHKLAKECTRLYTLGVQGEKEMEWCIEILSNEKLLDSNFRWSTAANVLEAFASDLSAAPIFTIISNEWFENKVDFNWIMGLKNNRLFDTYIRLVNDRLKDAKGFPAVFTYAAQSLHIPNGSLNGKSQEEFVIGWLTRNSPEMLLAVLRATANFDFGHEPGFLDKAIAGTRLMSAEKATQHLGTSLYRNTYRLGWMLEQNKVSLQVSQADVRYAGRVGANSTQRTGFLSARLSNTDTVYIHTHWDTTNMILTSMHMSEDLVVNGQANHEIGPELTRWQGTTLFENKVIAAHNASTVPDAWKPSAESTNWAGTNNRKGTLRLA